MAVTAKAFSVMPLNALKKLINDLNSGATIVKCALYTDAAPPTQEMANKTALDGVCTEVVGTGYTAGGATLASKAVTKATRVTKFDSDDVQWLTATITARYAVLYETENLLIWVNFGENKSSENGTFKIQFNAGGIFTITVAA